jgi:hypothetical protein
MQRQKPTFAAQMQFISIERVAPLGTNSTVMSVPYPTHIHFLHASSPSEVIIDYRAKDLLITSNWRTRFPLRKLLRAQCEEKPQLCEHYEPQYFDNTHITMLNRRAIFCLNPPGDSSTRASFYDSLLMGCIPVIFRPNVMYAYGDLIDYYGTMVVYIDENLILNGTANIVTQLQAIDVSSISRKQEAIEEYRPILQYSLQDYECDAFGFTLRRLYLLSTGLSTS